MFEAFVFNERGAVTIDWVALTAGIVVLGIVVVYAVMEDSAGYLLDGFDELNASYEESADKVAQMADEIDFSQ